MSKPLCKSLVDNGIQALVERVRAGTPLADFMQLEYLGSDTQHHRFGAPYARCKNQLDVGFGGAIATGLTLAGWFSFAQACEQLRGVPCNPVVARASQHFIKALRSDQLLFTAPQVVLTQDASRLRQSLETQAWDQQGQLCATAALEFVL